MWVGILIVCSAPVLSTCQLVTSPHGFANEEQCQAELGGVIQEARKRGIINMGACSLIKDPKGSPA